MMQLSRVFSVTLPGSGYADMFLVGKIASNISTVWDSHHSGGKHTSSDFTIWTFKSIDLLNSNTTNVSWSECWSKLLHPDKILVTSTLQTGLECSAESLSPTRPKWFKFDWLTIMPVWFYLLARLIVDEWGKWMRYYLSHSFTPLDVGESQWRFMFKELGSPLSPVVSLEKYLSLLPSNRSAIYLPLNYSDGKDTITVNHGLIGLIASLPCKQFLTVTVIKWHEWSLNVIFYV